MCCTESLLRRFLLWLSIPTSRACVSLIRLSGWCCVLAVLWCATPAARAGVSVDMHLYNSVGSYFAFPWLSFNDTTPNPPETGYFVWGPTSSQFSGIHYELLPNGTGGGSSGFSQWEDFIQAIHGNWTLMVTNETSTNVYTFAVDISDIESNDLPNVTVTHPALNATLTEPNPTFTWLGLADWLGSLNVNVRNSDNSFFQPASLPVAATSWNSPAPLPAGPLFFYVSYFSNITARVSVATPLHNVTSNPFPGWVAAANMETYSDRPFDFAPISGETHVLQGRFDFEDTGWLGVDSSGAGNGNNGGSGWGLPENGFDSDSIVGTNAGIFFGNGSVDWSAPSDGFDNMREVFAGSFSVSAWIKTSESIGDDGDAAIDGMTILWAYADPAGSIPLAVTGSKLAFFTGAESGPGHTLHSTSAVNDDTYHHVVVTRNLRTGEKKVYVDGVLEAAGHGSTDRLDGNAEKLSFGGSFNVFTRSYTGLLDDMQIYQGVLDAGQVATLFNNPGNTVPDLVVTEAIAHYTFGGGTVEAEDVSGYNNDIVLAGEFGGDVPEIFGGGVVNPGAVEFFGAGYLTAPRGLLNSLAKSFSVSLWVNTTQSFGDENDSAFLGAGVIAADVPGLANDLIPIALTSGQVAFNTGGGSDDTLNSPTLVNDGVWHHVVVTRNHVTGEKKIYVDRSLNTSGFGTTDVLNEPRLLTIGAISDAADPDPASPSDNGYNGFEGLLDDIQFYSGVLTESQVQFLYDHPGVAITNNSGGGGGGNTLEESVDAPTFTWTTGGEANWFYQTTETHDGVDAARSGAIGHNQETWMETVVNGPGTVSFWWKVSCEEIFFERPWSGEVSAAGAFIVGDYLDFILDGDLEQSIYGERGWEQSTVKLTPGSHTLRWRYSKDAAGVAGADAGWLDEFVFDPNIEPAITLVPGGVTGFTGTNISLAVELYGFPEPTIRWFKDSVLLPDQTNATLSLNNAQPSDSGFYQLTASNFLGVASTGNIRINVFDPTDLYPTSLSAPAVAGSQTLVPISWVVTNTGPGFASNTVDQVHLVLTNGNLISLGQMSRPAASAIIPPGGTYTLSNLFRLPSVGAGDYSVRVSLDVFGGMLELNETNNSFTSSPIAIINPDLQPGNLQAAPVGVGGLSFQITYNITNNGPGVLDGAGWSDHLVLSTDNQWSDDDLNLLQPFQTPSIGVGQSVARDYSVTLPVIPSGNYFIVVRLDRFGSFDHGNLWEVNETNNQAAIPLQLTVPDLVPTNILAPAQVSPSQPVNIEWSIQNVGDGVATAWNPGFFPKWYDRLYFSTNQFAGPGAVWTGDELGWNTPLPAGQFMTNSRTIEVPNLPEGDYFLVLASDIGNRVREINEDNNQLAVPIRVASPDLVPANLTAPTVVDAHSAIEVSWAVTNRGAGLAQPIWRDRLYLSTNDTFEATDTLLGEFERSTVTAGGGTYSETNNVFLPGVAPGSYFLIFRADARTNLFESVVTNNYIARAINIASPDLVVAALDAPTNTSSQQPITVTYSVANVGTATAQPVWYDRAFLSLDTVLDGADVPVGSPNNQTFNFLHTTALPVGNSYTQQVDLRIPSVPAGDYYLLFQTDGTNAFTEVNEANDFFAHAVQVFNPDLTPTNIIAPASITITQLNQRIEVGWQVLNQNTGTVQVSWSDYVYLSTDTVLDGSDPFIGSQGNSLNLGLNQSYLAFDNPTLPNGIQGQFYLLVRNDANGQVYEAAETNNILVSPLQVLIPPLPDLAVAQITAPIEALSGQEIEITWVLTNRGTAVAFGPFRERLYLTTTADGGGATEYGNFEFTGSIPPGGFVERIQRINLPINLSGQRWVLVVADANNNLFEFDQEGNNSLITVQPIDIILAPTPNLAVNSITVPTETFSGTSMLITWAVTNQGTGPTSSPLWYDGVYLSADTNFGGDTFLGHAPNAAYLSPGDSYASGTLVSIPRSLNGTHYFFVKSDNANYVFENTDENDNVTISGPVFINLTPPPDLRVGLVNAPLNGFSGQPVSLSWAITNYGVGQTLETTWNDRVYLSTNTTIDGSDFVLGALPHTGALEPGAGYRTTNTVNLPVGVTGNWYLLVLADAFGQVYEVPFESNNDGAPAFTTTIVLTPPPDLATTILASPSNALASHTLSVNYRVANDGATVTPKSSWVDHLYLSTDADFDAGSDLLVASLAHYDALPPGGAYTRAIGGVLPDGLSGTFHVFVSGDANNAVFELDNANNLALASGTVTVVSLPADFAVRSLTAPATVEAGTAMLVSWAVTNRSQGDSAVTRWSDRLVLSADDFVGDGDDVNLLDFQHDGLLGGTNEYAVNNVVVTMPINTTAGDYRLYVVTDRNNEVYEGVNETNNVSALRPLTVTHETADLQITAVTAPASAVAGGPFAAQWVVRNFGTRPPNTAYWVDSVYLSTDMVLSPGDLLLGQRQNISTPAPGGGYTNSLNVTLPHGLSGAYFLIVSADHFNYVVESGLEGNNQFVRTPAIAITPGALPDLAVTEVNAPTDAYSGQTFELSWTVQNTGTATANATWYDAIYLSLDHFFDPQTDTYLGFAATQTNLAAGQSYSRTGSFEIPAGYAGPFFVIVFSDVSGAVFEGGAENNNRAFDSQAMQVHLTPPVDLVAGPITVPANAAPGVNATIVFTIHNIGSNVARGSWEDALYISADTNYDVGDALFGRVRHVGDVPAGGSYSTNHTAPLPGVLPGDYHVIVRSDILNHVLEDNNTNNAGASLDLVAIDSEVLILGTPDTGQIAQGQSLYYKFNATAGETVRVRFTTGVPLAGNEIYVSRDAMPSRASFDFAVNEPFIADPDLFIPIAQSGTHYLLVFSGAMPAPAPYTILAEVLPFTVATVQPALAGNLGSTTFKVRGALLTSETQFELLLDTNVLTAAELMLEDSTTAFVTFNLVGQTNGVWTLKASMNETSVVVSALSNAITVVSGNGPKPEVAIDGALQVWAFFTQPVLLLYGNSGDSDALAPLLIAEGIGGTLVGPDRDHLQSAPLQILGRSLEGPADRLRPQSSFSHRLMYRGGELHVRARVIPTDDPRPVTEEDWLEIESSVRPAGSDPLDWQEFWSQLRPRIGATWGEYVRFLHVIAANLPAEKRVVREMIGSIFTNQPGFRASSFISGVVLGSTNLLPQADVEVGFYSVDTNGAVKLNQEVVTDSNGQFVAPFLQPGDYVCVVESTPFQRFDMNLDGVADNTAPIFTVPAGSDLVNQTIYLYQPTTPSSITNDTSATLAVDAHGVLHLFWYRDESLWHAWNDAGTWVDARSFTSNFVNGFTVGTSARLLDGSSPGMIIIWSEANTNGVQLYYAVGQTNGAGYRWSDPVGLTDDGVLNSSPSVVMQDDGLALITYLKRSLEGQDDDDVYFSVVDVASGELIWNRVVQEASEESIVLGKVKEAWKQNLSWTKAWTVQILSPDDYITVTLDVGGEFSRLDCEASAKLKGAVTGTHNTKNFKNWFKASGDVTLNWRVHPDECEWDYLEHASTGNFQIEVGTAQKNVVLRTFGGIAAASGNLPLAAFVKEVTKFKEGFEKWMGIKMEDTLEFRMQGNLKGLHWKTPPTGGFGTPGFKSAELTGGGAIRFTVKGRNENDILLLGQDFKPIGYKLLKDSESKGAQDRPTIQGGLELSVKGEVYPEIKAKTLTITPNLTFIMPGTLLFPGGVKFTPNWPEWIIDLEHHPQARDSFVTNFTLSYDPAAAVGTTNVYGTNSVIQPVGSDLYDDGAPSLALDANGVPYQVWFRNSNPYQVTQLGTEVYQSDYNGTSWNPPTVIPGTLGFNGQVNAATDRLGHRMVVWSHASTMGLTTNSTVVQFFDGRASTDIYYTFHDGFSWSTPQRVTATPDPDGTLRLSKLENGDLLAVWTSTDTNLLVSVLVSTWNGTLWSTPEVVTSGRIQDPTAHQTGSRTYVLWTQVIDTNDNRAIFQSVKTGGTWSPPELFVPKSAIRSGPSNFESVSYARVALKPTDLVFGPPPDKCCNCKGKTTTPETNGPAPPKPCGVSYKGYDYEDCHEVYEFKSCPLPPGDPNDIVGPAGFGPERWVGISTQLNYTIRFENDPELAKAPAKDVLITLPLDPDFDLSSFRLGSFGFGDLTIVVPDGQAFYSTTLDLTEERGFYVVFFAGVDVAKGEAFWRLSTIDPATGFLPLDPLLGFLPRNVTSPEGEGFVNFSLRSRRSSPTGAKLDAKATIIFDTEPPIDTPPIFNSIEAGLPASAVFPLPAVTQDPNFIVQWTALDNDGESGLAGVDVYVSEDGGDYFRWLADTTLTQSPFVGELGVEYSFYTVAKDNAGNVEPFAGAPDATILVALPNTPPLVVAETNRTIPALLPFTLQISATDTDAPPQSLTFELVNAPTGLTIATNTGLLAWTPTALQGGSTNPVSVRVTDNGTPPLNATAGFSIIVLPANTAPVFESATNLLVHVQQLARTRVEASDAETNAITYSFGPGVPAGATLDPDTGDFRWPVPLAAAGTTNVITVRATDDGTPSLNAIQQFSVAVPHFTWLTLGETNVFSGQTSSVPVRVVSSAPWRELSFELGLPVGTLGQLGLSNEVSLFTEATLLPVDAIRSLLAFSNAPGHELQGTQQLAQLTFEAVSLLSASVPLAPQDFGATFADGSPFLTALRNQGRVVIVADQPVLDAVTLISNRHLLRLYGMPGKTYEIQTATNVTPPVFWLPFTDLLLSNIVQTIEGDTNDAPFRIYRAVRP